MQSSYIAMRQRLIAVIMIIVIVRWTWLHDWFLLSTSFEHAANTVTVNVCFLLLDLGCFWSSSIVFFFACCNILNFITTCIKPMTHVRETRARSLYVCHTDLQQDISHASFSHQIEHVLFRASFSCVCHGLYIHCMMCYLVPSCRVLERLSPRAISSHLRMFADYLICEFSSSNGNQQITKCIESLNDLVWKCCIVPIDRLVLCLVRWLCTLWFEKSGSTFVMITLENCDRFE